MEFNCDVKIVDAMMGAGKSSAAINYIKRSKDEEKFLIITPYLREVERYKTECPNKKFKQPTFSQGKGSKFASIKTLIDRGENIVSTHALFQRFDNELIDMCRAKNYTLIMDEVANVIEEYQITIKDFDILKKDFVTVDEETGMITWRPDQSDYSGEFSEIKRLCDLGSLAYYSGSIMMWLFPIGAFNAFRKVFILTYMFNSQLQKYYYDFHNLSYEFLGVANLDGSYWFCPEDLKSDSTYDYKKLIHILDSEKMNMIGDRKTDLSVAWFKRNNKNSTMKVLKNNLANFFRHIRNDNSKDNLWTTFKEYKSALQGGGYSRGFLEINARATNDYMTRTSVAYIANRYMNPVIKKFFEVHDIEVNEDGYALSEMLQFIWRSAIRCGNEIWVYIPSSRMRKLLAEWIEENSK